MYEYTLQDAIDFYEDKIKEEANKLPNFIMGPDNVYQEIMKKINIFKNNHGQAKNLLSVLKMVNYKSKKSN